MSVMPIENKRVELNWRDLLLPVMGVAAALMISAALFNYWLNMDQQGVISMVIPFAQAAIVTNIVGIIINYCTWFYSRSVRWTALITSLLVGVLTLINGWFAAETMFGGLDDFILKDAVILLIFATAISLAFNLMGYTRLTRNLSRLNKTAQAIGDGNLRVRARLDGRDELAQLGTQFNQMAYSLELAEAERAKLEKMRRDLIAWVSHDLRTPLTSIRAIVEALNDDIVTEKTDIKRYYDTILQDIMGLDNLINELFEMAQLDAGQTDFARYSIPVRGIVGASVAALSPVAQKNGIVIVDQINPAVTNLHINPEKVNRVLNNIISNALKYTPEGGFVIVEVQPAAQPDMAQIAITDTGSGFDEDDIPHLFDQFYRGDNARSRTKTGSAGLGLAISRSIVHAHGGEIWASNAAAGGAMITFTLPMSK